MNEPIKLEWFDLSVPVKIEVVVKDQEGETLSLTTKDIFAGGAFFTTPYPLPKGTQVKIDLILGRGLRDVQGSLTHIEVGCSVLRSDTAVMDICFDKSYKIIPHINT